MTEHTCHCPTCDPSIGLHVLPATRLHEGHVANRFRDFPGPPGQRLRALLDGEDVSDRCVEAIAGRPGLVVLLGLTEQREGGRPVFHLCRRCRGQACQEYVRGEVTLLREPVEVSP